MVKDCLAAAVHARTQLAKFVKMQVSREQLLGQLEGINLQEIAANYWDSFQSNIDPICTTCLEVHQIINSLREELDYQLQFYGYDSLLEDVRQLDLYIGKLDRFQKKEPDVI